MKNYPNKYMARTAQHSTHFSWAEIVSEFVSELFWLKEVIFVFCLPMNCITMTNCMPESAV